SIIKSALVSAHNAHPGVKLCHLVTEATHVHLVLVVIVPEDVQGFVKCFKTESAHAFNKILGRKKHTIWCEGCDSPVVLSFPRALIAISYLYTNPGKDGLADSINDYAGFSTWKMFKKKEHSKFYKRIRRFQYEPLTRDAHNLRGYTKVASDLTSSSKELLPFVIEPNAWMEAFGISDPKEQEEINQRLMQRIEMIEQRFYRIRTRQGKRAIKQDDLRAQRINPHHQIKNYRGRRTLCLSELRAKRNEFIRFFRRLMAEAREVLKR